MMPAADDEDEDDFSFSGNNGNKSHCWERIFSMPICQSNP